MWRLLGAPVDFKSRALDGPPRLEADVENGRSKNGESSTLPSNAAGGRVVCTVAREKQAQPWLGNSALGVRFAISSRCARTGAPPRRIGVGVPALPLRRGCP